MVLGGVAGLLVTGAGMAAGQAAASGPAAEVQRSYAGLKGNIVKAADKMPAGDYQFKPTPEVRTFARVVNHVIEAQARTCGAANHTAPGEMVKVPARARTRRRWWRP